MSVTNLFYCYIPAVHPDTIPPHTHTHTRAAWPRIQASCCCHEDHFNSVSTSEVCLKRSNLPLSPSFYPTSFSPSEKKIPILHSREAWLFLLLFFLSDSFTHNVWQQQSPLLLLSPLLYTAFISVCIHLLFPYTERVLKWGKWEENVHLMLISTTQDKLNTDSWYFSKFLWGTQGDSLMYRLS